MNGVIGMVSLLLDTELTDEQREYVEATRSSADALLTIINDILDFSKIEAGKLDLEHHPFELHTCIEEALDLLAPAAAEKKLDLAYNVDDIIPKILVSDVTRLRQILVNLVANAIKFTTHGEIFVEVTAAAHGYRTIEPGHEQDTDFVRHPEQWLLHFSVRDTGIGIPRERQHRLFKSFQQVDASTTRHYGGTGLGLAICKRLAELMGGRIWVDSDAGKGATFHFTITTKATAATAPPNWQTPQPQLAGRRLLVVEDSATNRRIITHRAEQWGMAVECVTTGRDALKRLAETPAFDAVLFDLQLPEFFRPAPPSTPLTPPQMGEGGGLEGGAGIKSRRASPSPTKFASNLTAANCRCSRCPPCACAATIRARRRWAFLFSCTSPFVRRNCSTRSAAS
ncbi:MAG: ATP-binding protein [Verrucomicrobia bacterium]|nr:ATP-binding protein [Verrucomicrobiota bacterium]